MSASNSQEETFVENIEISEILDLGAVINPDAVKEIASTWRFGLRLVHALYVEVHHPGHSEGATKFMALINDVYTLDSNDQRKNEIQPKDVDKLFEIIITIERTDLLSHVLGNLFLPNTSPNGPMAQKILKKALRAGRKKSFEYLLNNGVQIDISLESLPSLMFNIIKGIEIGYTNNRLDNILMAKTFLNNLISQKSFGDDHIHQSVIRALRLCIVTRPFNERYNRLLPILQFLRENGFLFLDSSFRTFINEILCNMNYCVNLHENNFLSHLNYLLDLLSYLVSGGCFADQERELFINTMNRYINHKNIDTKQLIMYRYTESINNWNMRNLNNNALDNLFLQQIPIHLAKIIVQFVCP